MRIENNNKDQTVEFECTENLQKNRDLIIETIAHAYETGILEEPTFSHTFGSLLALVCEDKVEGEFGENRATGPLWKLTAEYEAELVAQRAALASKNVVAGPW